MFVFLCRSYGTQEGYTTFFYKHIVPTGLKIPHNTNQILKLTVMCSVSAQPK